jgi:SAM-dependent methyltransferase
MNKINWLSYNWLAHKGNNETLKNNIKYIKGIVYDLGCGDEPYKDIIEKYADKYIGVDWGNSFHKQKMDITADLNKPLPILNNVADTVVSFQVMEHLCEPQSFLNEAYRILKPNCYILLTVPFQWWVHEAPYDYYRYTRYGLKYLFQKAGFKEVKVTASSGFWLTWILKFNYHSRRFIRGPRPIKWLIKFILIPIWFLGQKVAPVLDKYDRNENETSGYIVIAKK